MHHPRARRFFVRLSMRRSKRKSSPLADPSSSHTTADAACEPAIGTPIAPARPSTVSSAHSSSEINSTDENAGNAPREHAAASAGSDAGCCPADAGRGSADPAGLADIALTPAQSTGSAVRTRAAALEAVAAAPSPAAELTAPAMDERAAKVFPLDATEPKASTMGAVAYGQPSNQHVLLVSAAAGRRCDAHGTALSHAYGNFDRVVAAGWLIYMLLTYHIRAHRRRRGRLERGQLGPLPWRPTDGRLPRRVVRVTPSDRKRSRADRCYIYEISSSGGDRRRDGRRCDGGPTAARRVVTGAARSAMLMPSGARRSGVRAAMARRAAEDAPPARARPACTPPVEQRMCTR